MDWEPNACSAGTGDRIQAQWRTAPGKMLKSYRDKITYHLICIHCEKKDILFENKNFWHYWFLDSQMSGIPSREPIYQFDFVTFFGFSFEYSASLYQVADYLFTSISGLCLLLQMRYKYVCMYTCCFLNPGSMIFKESPIHIYTVSKPE